METFAARLASFSITYPLSKKRSSNAKGTKSIRWRHGNPGPDELARAGFFYRPTPSSPDNAQCFLCEYNLDGWEENDDAIVEHLKHSPNCGWAIVISLEARIDDENVELDDPLSERLLNAREMTFGSRWPHEAKKGWICKTQKMIESGWYYSPMEEGDDYVRCPYCSLALDGWERKDNPFDEHQRRSPNCMFFSLIASTKIKTHQSRKNRASKASRKSTQSDFTVVSEEASMMEGELIEENSRLLHSDEAEQSLKTGRGRKKAARSKKPSIKPRIKGSKLEPEESVQASSFVEPEDDNFEVKINAGLTKTTKGRKRLSDRTSENLNAQQLDSETPEVQPPPTKRRVTRARSSVMHAELMPILSPQNDHENSISMVDTESGVPSNAPLSKKGAKKGRKRASSTVRKTSARSAASVAPLRCAPDDEAIDAVLEADLDRPITSPVLSIKAVEKTLELLSSPSSKEKRVGTSPPVLLSETQATPKIDASPQSSDAENHPPSSRPSVTRPPLLVSPHPSTPAMRTPLASATPMKSSSKRNPSRLQSSVPWTAVELEKIFLESPVDKENSPFALAETAYGVKYELQSPEKRLTVEEWVKFNAKKGEAKLRNECERIIGKFEGEGVRALRTLEGIICID